MQTSSMKEESPKKELKKIKLNMNKTIILLAIVVIAVVGIFVSLELLKTPEQTSQYSFIDDYDRNVSITNYPPEKIVSLAPSCTEILFALNLGDKIVGVDNYDHYPSEIQEKIVSNNITKVGQYAEISAESIINLNPDLVIGAMSVQLSLIEILTSTDQAAMMINPETYADVINDITMIGEATGQIEQAQLVVTAIQNKAQEIVEKTQDANKTRVYIEYAFNGGFQSFGTGSFADELINKAGGSNIFTNSASAYVSASSEEIIVNDPEIIIIASGAMSEACGLTPEVVENRPGWDNISAVKNDQIYEIDERLFLPGVAMDEALETLAATLHPELFN